MRVQLSPGVLEGLIMKNEISKYLTYALRHDPEKIGIELNREGWATVEALVQGVRQEYPSFTEAELDAIVKSNDKQRFEYDVTGTLIRACQGHSVPVDLKLPQQRPPFLLYHGTIRDNLPSIMKKGLLPGTRIHVHLSEDIETAEIVGKRRGTPVILRVLAQEMDKDGAFFYRSSNGVWLTEHVPPDYIEEELPNYKVDLNRRRTRDGRRKKNPRT